MTCRTRFSVLLGYTVFALGCHESPLGKEAAVARSTNTSTTEKAKSELPIISTESRLENGVVLRKTTAAFPVDDAGKDG